MHIRRVAVRPFITERRDAKIYRNIGSALGLAPIRRLSDALRLAGQVEFDVVENYFEALSNGRVPGYRRLRQTLSQYFSGLETPHWIGSRSMISEADVPTEIGRQLRLPQFSAPVVKVQFFAGRRRCASDLHCDWHPYSIFHYVVCGVKRITIFPARASAAFFPNRNFATKGPIELRSNRAVEFAVEFGGVTFEVKALDAISIPPFTWHHFNYEEDSISLSLRYGNVSNRILVEFARQPRAWQAQAALSQLFEADQMRTSAEV